MITPDTPGIGRMRSAADQFLAELAGEGAVVPIALSAALQALGDAWDLIEAEGKALHSVANVARQWRELVQELEDRAGTGDFDDEFSQLVRKFEAGG